MLLRGGDSPTKSPQGPIRNHIYIYAVDKKGRMGVDFQEPRKTYREGLGG